jgi:hypothetical protein
MQSARVDSYLLVTGPNGGAWENDDSGGVLDSTVAIAQAQPGQYRIVATTYRASETGAYELKVLTPRPDWVAASPTDPGAPVGAARAGAERTVAGDLAAGDRQLASGEYYDEHTFTWAAGTPVHLEARSSEFDTYLILRSPSGEQTDNDDQAPGVLNAALDFVVREDGEHRVLVTSYRPGENGRYELGVRGDEGTPGIADARDPGLVDDDANSYRGRAGRAGRAGRSGRAGRGGRSGAAAGPITGQLERSDRTLSSGEYVDMHPMTFTAGQPVSIRLESTEFDTYLIVRSPSGRQDDNDDVRPGILNSGIDIPAAEAGEYQIGVTSYRPGETGRYTLTVAPGAGAMPGTTIPQPGIAMPGTTIPPPGTGPIPPPPGGHPPLAGGSRVWVLSVGISDYPGGGNDLPECANDAVKIAEALRNQGLTSPEREILLTDSQATTSAIRQAMQRVAQQIQPSDTFVFFYSGHGGQNQSRSSDVRELDGIDEYIQVYDGPIVDDELGRLFDAVHASTSLAAMDACFAGGFSKDIVTRPGVVGMFSSEEDVTSGVALQFQAGGYLSHFLRLGIQGQADDDPQDSVMTVGELTHFVWQQYAHHATDVRMGDSYQHLVVDRGAVHTTQQLWRAGH